LLSAVLTFGGGLTAVAQESPGAVGRITYGTTLRAGAAICTGALVAPDLVLTAGHCVRAIAGNPASVRFSAAWDAGQSLAERRGAQVIAHQDPTGGQGGPAGDVALVVLDQPISPEIVPYLALGDASGQQFTLVAYRRDNPDKPERADDCRVIDRVPGLLGLTCAVVSGNSGAPLIKWDGVRWQITAVMVSSYKGPLIHSLAALVPSSLARRIIANTSPNLINDPD